MKKTFDKTDREDGQVNHEAINWFTRLLDASVQDDTRRAFATWYARCEENRRAYDRVAEFWDSESFGRAVGADAQRLERGRVRKPRSRVPALAMAASLLVGVWSVFYGGWIDRLNADLYTAVGERRTLEMPDGSRVQLDTDSAIALAYTDNRRAVELSSGRAFFDVRRDARRPFVVRTDRGEIRVVGTRFSVDDEGAIALSVEQGAVVYRRNGGGEIAVTAGNQLTMDSGAPIVTPVPRPREAYAWTQGRLAFRNRPLSEVIAELDRYQPGVIVIGNRNLTELRVTGNYKLNHPSQIIDSLARASGANVSRLTGYVTVLY